MVKMGKTVSATWDQAKLLAVIYEKYVKKKKEKKTRQEIAYLRYKRLSNILMKTSTQNITQPYNNLIIII